MEKSQFDKIIIKLVTGKVEKYESILIVLVLGILLLNILESVVVQPITIIVLSTLAILYIMTAYKDVPETDFLMMDLFFLKIGAFSSAMALIGTQFFLMDFPGFKPMLFVGAASLIGTLIYILIKGRIKNFGEWTVLRMAILAIIASGILLQVVT